MPRFRRLESLDNAQIMSGDRTLITKASCFQVLDVSEAKLVRFFDPEMETLDNGTVEGNEIEQLVSTQGATQPIHDDQERRAEAPSQMEIVLGVEVFGLSIIDQQPRELIFLVMKKVDIVFASGLGENVSR